MYRQACGPNFADKPDDVFYLVFPRLAALAELAWIPEGTKDWTSFLKGLDNYIAHLDSKGIVYARSMYNIQHQVISDGCGYLKVTLTCERPDLEIRYTLNGQEPVYNSSVYTDTLTLSEDIVVKAATFCGKRKMGETLVLPLNWNKATGKELVNAAPEMNVLVNGLRGSLKQTDFEWYTGAISKPIEVTVDLAKNETIKNCTVGCITNYGMAVHKPKLMKVEVSSDNLNYKEVGRLTFKDKDIFKEGNFIEDLSVNMENVQARYVRFTFEVPGNCPEDHVRPGQASRIYLDEIMIH